MTMELQTHAPSLSAPARLATRGVGRVFATTRVLSDVSIEVRAGEVVGLIGENGAGKSTLMDIMCGALSPTDGEVVIDGESVEMRSLIDGAEKGIFRVFQEQSLIPRLSVAMNLCFGAENRFSVGGVLQISQVQLHARALLDELGLEYDIHRAVDEYSFAHRQLLEVARAISLSRIFGRERPIILMDEPTAALVGAELETFFGLVTRLRKAGAGFVFISHRLAELVVHSDRLYVLKDGELVTEVPPTTGEAELHRLMVGRPRGEDIYWKHRQTGATGGVRLEARSLRTPGIEPTNLKIHAGEIVGVGGLPGSGKSQLAAALWGVTGGAGTVLVDGAEVRRTVAASVERGMGYIPLHRHAEGASLGLSISDNINEVRLSRGAFGTLRNKTKERSEALTWAKRLRVRMHSIDQRVRTLSGGNQQKVVFAKWLAQGAEVIIADNPTRGVDAGAKEEIYELLRNLTDKGAAVLLVSDDLIELIGLSDRILVMHDGRIAGELPSPKDMPAKEEDVVALMV